MEKSKPAPWDTAPMIDATNDNRKGSRNTFSEMTNAKEKIESAQQSSGNFMSCNLVLILRRILTSWLKEVNRRK